jgi:hypothetical protein
MASFDQKKWLDDHVVPLLQGNPPLSLYHPFWNGVPPKDVLVLLLAEEQRDEESEFDPSAWPRAVKRLIDDHGFCFDFTREQIAVHMDHGLLNLFGGDGAPLFNPEGMASARLYRKEPDGIGLIVQVACRYPSTAQVGDAPRELTPGEHAAAATKAFYALFEENPLEVCQKYGARFGQA